MLVNVNLTQDDIDKGEPCSACRCAISRACLRAVPEADHVRVEPTSKTLQPDVRITFCCPAWPHSSITVDAPASVAAFVNDYDLGKPVRPFTFTLEIPEV